MTGSSSKRKLHLGILSAALIAKKNVRGIFQNHKGVEVVAVASRSLDKANTFIKETGLEGKATAYGSYEELLDDDNIHAVYIPLPAGPRPQWVKRAAAKGKHVMGEKPIALSVKETVELIQACRDAGVMYMDGTMWLHNPRTHHMKEIMSNQDTFGVPRSVTTCFYMLASEDFRKNDVRVKKDLDGLGCLGDIGWYCLSVTLFAFDYAPPSQVQAHIGSEFNAEGVLMRCGATLTWQDGRHAVFDCAYGQNWTQLANVCGSKSFLQWTDFCNPWEEDSCEFLVVGPGGLSDLDTRINQERQVKKVNLERPQETYMWEDFAECVYAIQDGKQPNSHWPAISELTSKCVLVVEESINNGCKAVNFEA